MRLLFLRLLGLLARPFVVRPLPGTPRRILVIKPDHLGDLLLATPALRRLRAAFPTSLIVTLVGPWSARVLAGNPDVDIVQTLPFPGFERRPPHPPLEHFTPIGFTLSAIGYRLSAIIRPYLALLHYAALLRAGRFDAALLLRDDHWWGAALALLAGIPVRVGHAAPECQPLLSRALPLDRNEHVAAQALAVIEALVEQEATKSPPQSHPALNPERVLLRFTPSDEEAAWAEQWCSKHLALGERLVVVQPGTGGPAKLWPAEKWVAVADALVQEHGLRLVITGGPGEEGLAEQIAAGMRRPALVLAGSMSIGQLVALLGRAALVLGVDSGPLHLAVSQGTPSVHLFGPSDHGRFGPWGEPTRHRVVRTGLWCSPCGIFSACPRNTNPPECMAQIRVAQVLEAARAVLR